MTDGRPTPRLDALLLELADVLQVRGARTDLARIIAREAGITLPAAKNRVTRITGREIVPNGEDTLIIRDFIDAR